ncbi:MAG: hypothetical protein CVU17_03890 [Betaproteobacteria bacterium HGW-Betaproteobacteria-11]|nr:MAG: hypothetical protein CVU17_03890 [Betaproteobacteria bacterium HGW-Betaproteobacteria-11]
MLKTDMRSCLKASVLALALASLAFTAEAAGLGRITVLSALGQPLKAELEVSATRDEAQSLVARVAPAEAFVQAGVEYVPALAALRFSRDIKERDGRRFIQVTTDRPLNEPFIDMLVELSWASGRLVREFTFLLDPPNLAPAPAEVVAPEVRPEAKTEAVATHPIEQAPALPAAGGATGDARPAVPRPGAQVAQQPAAGREPAPAAKTGSMKSLQATPPASTGTHKVVAGETLTRIAAQTKADGISLEQMLVALFRSNGDAFDGNNMNRLRAGKILTLPAPEEAEKIPAAEARHEIVAQAGDFNVYRRKLAAAAAAGAVKDEGVTQSASGKIVPKVEDKATPPGGGKDKLEVSRSEVAKDVKGGGKDKAAQNRVALLEEELLTRGKALEEANSRTAELEKNLIAMKKLAELKSQSGAALQQQAQAAKPAPAVPPSAPPAQIKAPEPAKAAASAPAEAAKPDEAPKLPAPPTPKKRPMPPPEPEPEPGFLEEQGLLVLGGAGVVTLLLGWLGLSALRKKRKAGAEAGNELAAGGLSAHSVFSATTIAPPPSEQEPSQFSQFSVATAAMASAPSDTMDALVEADTFLAFGRDAQAEEVLLAALEKEPERLPLYLKLLEIYAGRRNIKQFEAMAKRLQVQTGSNGPEWERALALGAGIDPGNVLYQPSAVAEPPVAASPVPAETKPDFDATLVLSASPLSEAATGKMTATVAEPALAAEPPPAFVVNSGVIDFDLDLDLGSSGAQAESSAAATPETPEATQVIRPAAEMSSLDFDLDLGAPEMPAASVTAAAPRGLDLPLSKEEGGAAAGTGGATGAATTGTSTGSIDFDFDLGTADTSALSLAESAAQARESAVTAAVAPLDLGGVSLELEPPAAAPATTLKADDSEVATKLELATAYEEMGDKEGARELYQEALAEGSLAQQERARARLAALS